MKSGVRKIALWLCTGLLFVSTACARPDTDAPIFLPDRTPISDLSTVNASDEDIDTYAGMEQTYISDEPEALTSSFEIDGAITQAAPIEYETGADNIWLIPEELRVASDTPGSLSHITWYDHDDNKRQACIYYPPDYDASKRYPILYIMHGGGNGHPNPYDWVFKEHDFPNVLDNMINKHIIKPCVVVGLSWAPDYSPNTFASNYVYDLLTSIESIVHTYADFDTSESNLVATADYRVMSGFSNGAYFTWHVMANDNHKYFRYFAPCSAYGGTYDYSSDIAAIEPYADDLFIWDFIGEYETGSSGVPAWQKRTELFQNSPYFEKNGNYRQYIGLGHRHTVYDCCDYIHTVLMEWPATNY
jgi:hypothetical protein